MNTFNLSSLKFKLIFAALVLNIVLLGCKKDSQHSKPDQHTIDPLVVGRIAEDSLFRDYAYAMNPNYRQLILELNPVKSDQDTATNWRAVLLVERRAAVKWRKLQLQYGLQGDSVAAQYAAAAYKQFFEKRFGAASNKAMSQPRKSIKTAAISRKARTESFKEIMSTSQAAHNLQVQENDCSGAVCIARPPNGYIFLPPVEGQCCPKMVKFFTQEQADFMRDPSKREFSERLSTYLYKMNYSDQSVNVAKSWVDFLVAQSNNSSAKSLFHQWIRCATGGCDLMSPAEFYALSVADSTIESVETSYINENERGRRYDWVFCKQYFNFWRYVSRDSGYHRKDGGVWKWKSIKHISEYLIGFQIGMSVTVEDVVADAKVINDDYARVYLDYNIKTSAVYTGSPLSFKTPQNSGKHFDVNQ